MKSASTTTKTKGARSRAHASWWLVLTPPPLNLLCYKNVITYAKEFVYVFVHFLLV